jgi:hypothetical protein
MRTILYIFTILFTTTAIGQTKLDTLVFNEINNYRVSKGLEKVELNNAFYTEALNHCNYMDSEKAVSHDGYETRYHTITNEITGMVKTTSKTSFIIVKEYSESPKHNEALMNTKFKYVTVFTINTVFKTHGVEVPVTYSTIVFFNQPHKNDSLLNRIKKGIKKIRFLLF